MTRISLHWFEELVSQAMDQLPPEFVLKLDNVAVVVEPWPTFAHLQSVDMVHIHDHVTAKPDTVQPLSWAPKGLLFGLYQGVPRTQPAGGVMHPAKITLFAGPIMAVCQNEAELKAKIIEVLKHEVGHHFGMSDHHLKKLGY